MKPLKQNLKVGFLSVLLAAGLMCPNYASAAEKEVNVWCAKTNTGNYFPLVRVSMMVVPDGGSTFEILLKDGAGEANVQSITFEKHKEVLDLDKYKVSSDGTPSIDLSKKCYMFCNTGKFFSLGADKPMLDVNDGSNKFKVTDRNGNTLAENVEEVKFVRTNEPTGVEAIEAEEENLTLQSPIQSQMQISGCGEASKAVIYDMSGKQVGIAPVSAGSATVVVNELPAGIYIVKVGKKSLKFVKK